jgi:transketolase
VLFYGGIVKFDAKSPNWVGRDRVIISKGHGSISFFPILADLGYFDPEELLKVGTEGTFLGGIPDPIIPGYETANGSLGHGLGVGCGIALTLKKRKRPEKVIVIIGDGELNEGSIWEAIMFAAFHKLDNLILIVDKNQACMLDFCKNVINLDPLEEKIKVFGWATETVDGHNVEKLYAALSKFGNTAGRPMAIIAETVKGKGVPKLESAPLSHIMNLSPSEVDEILVKLP